MDWRKFIDKLKKQGYDGATDNFDEVTLWLKENGFDAQFGESKGGKKISLKEMWENRPGQAIDLTDIEEESEREADIRKATDERIGELQRAGLIERKGRSSEGHPHQVRVIKERIEDDPCLGYPKYEELGFGVWMSDVRQHAICCKEGRTDEIPQRLVKAQQVLVMKAGLGMNEQTDSDGGFLALTEHRNELLRRTYETGRVFPRARQVGMTSKTLDTQYIVEISRVDGSRHGGVQGYWAAEGAALIASRPSLGLLTLTAHKLTALGYLTSEVDEDSASQGVGAMQLLGELFAEELAFKIDDAFIRGSGAGMPLGILNSPALITLAARNLADRFNANDAAAMWARLWAKSQANAVWFIAQDVLSDLIMFTGNTVSSTTVAYFVPGPISFTAAGQMMIFGRPVIVIEQCASIAEAGSVILADMTQYLHGNRRGVTTASSIHVRFLTDEVAFRATMRADGQPWWQAPLTPFLGTNTVSPFITIPT